jgi:hypothetical protein
VGDGKTKTSKGGEGMLLASQEKLLKNFPFKFGRNSPLVKSKGKTYLRFNNIYITHPTPKSTKIEFAWNGEMVNELIVEGDMVNGEILTLSGIDGRQQVIGVST